MRDRVVGQLRPLPALVAVHRVVAADDRGDPVLRQLGEICERGVRRDVAAVGEGVQPRLLGREPKQRLDVLDVRVDAAVRDEAEQVHALAALERRPQHGVLEERAVLDRLVDAHQILVEPTPGPDRQVAHLAVPHLTGRQAGGLAGGLDRRVRELAPQPVEHRRLGQLDGVARPGRRAAPAVEDDERYEWDAVRHKAANESTSREAPPTRAPSTALCESSSAAFSGLTEPP